jgi:shikimate kinase
MKLTKAEFQQQQAANTLRVAFVGMSNIGKSRLAKDLERKGGWTRFDIDKQIGQTMDLGDLRNMAAYLGFPTSPTYAEREKEFLAKEEVETRRAIEWLDAAEASTEYAPTNIVLDTTGSVVYLAPATIREIKKRFLVVHVGTSAKDVDELFQTYKETPKPVVWHGMYREAPKGTDLLGLSTAEAEAQKDLEYSYRALLADRLMRYTLMADVTINRFLLYKPKTVADMLKAIEKAL